MNEPSTESHRHKADGYDADPEKVRANNRLLFPSRFPNARSFDKASNVSNVAPGYTLWKPKSRQILDSSIQPMD